MQASELPSELSERGIWWQVGGFTLTGCLCVAILAEFAGSEARAYLYFEIAVTKVYWAFVIPLAGLFDGVRKLFEKRSAIRAKIRQQGVEEGLRQGRQQGVEQGRQQGVEQGRQQGVEEGLRQGRRQERRRISETLRRFGTRDEASGAVTLTLTPEAMALLLDLDDPDDAGE